MTQPPNRKLIEVALPPDAINAASSREKSIRHGVRWRRSVSACRPMASIRIFQPLQRWSSDPFSLPPPHNPSSIARP